MGLRSKKKQEKKDGQLTSWVKPFGTALVFFFFFGNNVSLFLRTNEWSTEISGQYSDIDLDAPLQADSLSRTTSQMGADPTRQQSPYDSTLPMKQENNEDEDGESFSACLLWMDDNFRLEEWLAYHYYFMKLRYVVIAVDHWNTTSVDDIVNRWNGHGEHNYDLGMTIKIWKDEDYMPDIQTHLSNLEEEKATNLRNYAKKRDAYHRGKQPIFYQHCSKHLLEQNKSWTTYHDIDEFVTLAHKVYNKEGEVQRDISDISARKMEEPGYLLRKLNEIRKQAPPDAHNRLTGFSCAEVQRVRYCAKEMSTEETNSLVGTVIPMGLFEGDGATNATTDKDREAIVRRFDTLRYKYRMDEPEKNPKSFMDLSQPNVKECVQKEAPKGRDWQADWKCGRWMVHKPLNNLCNNEASRRPHKLKELLWNEHFIVNHYLGSFQAYSSREDARKGNDQYNFERWEMQSNMTSGDRSHVIRPWLKGFVELVGGPKVASYLLQDAGRFPEGWDEESSKEEYRLQHIGVGDRPLQAEKIFINPTSG